MPVHRLARTIGFVVAALLVGAAVAVAPTTAASPAAGAAASPPGLDDFVLQRTDLDLRGRVERLDQDLPTRALDGILAQANRPATFGSCNPAAFGDRGEGVQHWCWDSADAGTIDGDEGSGRVEWMPQGVTTIADARPDEGAGGRQPLLVSWYDKRLDPEKGVRVSFLDPGTGRYQHVVLAYPYINSAGNPSYEILDTPQSGEHGGIHAGGVVWYGDHLYLVDTQRGVRVFDTRRIFDLEAADNGDTSDGARIGRHDGTYYGFGYRYVMPQVDAWTNDAGPDNDGDSACEATGAPKFSYAGLDRSTSPHQLVTGEYCRNDDPTDVDRNGRVAAWPLDEGTGQPATGADGRWRATSAHRLPQPNIQGAVSHEGVTYLSRSRGEDANGHLIHATPDGSPTGTLQVTETRWAGIGVEDLSYWPSQDAIWTATEHPGRRAIYSCPLTTPPDRAGLVCGTVE
jgi:hypothetical protein